MVLPASNKHSHTNQGIRMGGFVWYGSWVAEISDETLGGPEDISEDPRDPGSPSENGNLGGGFKDFNVHLYLGKIPNIFFR